MFKHLFYLEVKSIKICNDVYPLTYEKILHRYIHKWVGEDNCINDCKKQAKLGIEYNAAMLYYNDKEDEYECNCYKDVKTARACRDGDRCKSCTWVSSCKFYLF